MVLGNLKISFRFHEFEFSSLHSQEQPIIQRQWNRLPCHPTMAILNYEHYPISIIYRISCERNSKEGSFQISFSLSLEGLHNPPKCLHNYMFVLVSCWMRSHVLVYHWYFTCPIEYIWIVSEFGKDKKNHCCLYVHKLLFGLGKYLGRNKPKSDKYGIFFLHF